MARPKSLDGRRVHENVMLSEAEAALLDAARGDVKRGPWMREAALEAARSCQARRKDDSGILETLGIGITVDPRQPPGIVSVIAPGEEVTQVRSFALAPEEPAPRPGRKPAAKGPCEHRIKPGSYCHRCQRLI